MAADRGPLAVWYTYMLRLCCLSSICHMAPLTSDRNRTKRRTRHRTRFVVVAKITRAKGSSRRLKYVLEVCSCLGKMRFLPLKHARIGFLGALQRATRPIHGLDRGLAWGLDMKEGRGSLSRGSDGNATHGVRACSCLFDARCSFLPTHDHHPRLSILLPQSSHTAQYLTIDPYANVRPFFCNR
jgi:hypothetical protein